MPVELAITVADPPGAPAGYTLCAFAVARQSGAFKGADALVNFPGTTDGYESAANVLARTVLDALAANDPMGFRLFAVAWWSERSFDLAPPGLERLVSEYDAAAGRWREWGTCPANHVAG